VELPSNTSFEIPFTGVIVMRLQTHVARQTKAVLQHLFADVPKVDA
jgi:hypothetical protein